MRLPLASPAVLLSTALIATADPTSDAPPVVLPCTATSPHTGNFFDLRTLARSPGKTPPDIDWQAKGQDYGSNFTINICAPVLADVSKVEGVAEANRKNVSASYEKDGKVYSIGSLSTELHFRGRKLILEYKDGSPCPDSPNYRKTTLMSLMCDRDMHAKASIAFVGQSNDCAYFFEVRTAAACPTVQVQALGPFSVFGVIGLVAALVYCVGGCVYQRTVMHARGWRQIPHYHAWVGAVMFVWNSLKNLCTNVTSHLPFTSNSSSARYSRSIGVSGGGTTGNGSGGVFGSGGRRGDRFRGVNSVAGGAGAVGQGRSSLEDENQLIDELDDEWDE